MLKIYDFMDLGWIKIGTGLITVKAWCNVLYVL